MGKLDCHSRDTGWPVKHGQKGAISRKFLPKLFFPILLLASPVAGAPRAGSEEDAPHCPLVVQNYLETVGLLTNNPSETPPVIVIDLKGAPVDCLPRSLSPADHAEAARMLHESSQLFSNDNMGDTFHTRYGRACIVVSGTTQNGAAYLGFIVSYDLQQMTRAECIRRASSDLERYRTHSRNAPSTSP